MSGVRARFGLVRGAFRLAAELEAPGRGVTAIFGPSGSGKTTLLRCVAGLERASDGLLEVAGERWQDSSTNLFVPPHRRGVGYVPQEAFVFPHLSVRGNLEYGLRRLAPALRRVRFEQAVEWLGLGSLVERRPDGLSGGERQRVAIARALLAGPRLLLLDEPLASLDEESRAEILPRLERLPCELSVPLLYVSHSRAEVLRLADHVVLLEGGTVRAAGPLVEIAARPDLAPFGTDADLGTVVETLVCDRDERFGLIYLEFPGGRLAVPGTDLAPGTRRRVRLLARDVSLTLDPPARTSILNVIRARVVEILEPARPLPVVRLDAGGTLLLARITRKSVHELELAPGRAVYAQIKSVALL